MGSSNFVFLNQGLPGPGFFPMVLSVSVVLLSSLVLLGAVREKAGEINMPVVKTVSLFFLFLAICLAVLPEIVGLIPALGIFYIAALRIWNNLPLKSAAINGLISMALLYVIFVSWLGVDMPWGVFHQFIY